VSSARTRWHWEPRGTGTGVCAISGVGLRNGPCSLSEASVSTSSLEKDNLCALHRSLTAGEVGLCTSLHWKAVVQSDADAAISVAHFVSQADHRPHADPPSTGRASDRLRLHPHSGGGGATGHRNPECAPHYTIAKADHHTILLRHNPEAIRDVDLTARCGLQARAGMLPTAAVSRSVEGSVLPFGYRRSCSLSGLFPSPLRPPLFEFIKEEPSSNSDSATSGDQLGWWRIRPRRAVARSAHRAVPKRHRRLGAQPSAPCA
jgi:hypothetical protein